MPFRIDFTGLAGVGSVKCETALDALTKVLELEERPHGTIMVKDETGRSISYSELSALCDAGKH
jgi:hypothetical protein